MHLFAFIFSWWGSALGAGALAVSVPIIIHLLNRRRYKIVTWAAMRFLLAAQRQNTRRLRLEQLILLLVRTALVALIVFAMASVMPWAETLWAGIWPAGLGVVAPRTQRVHHVLVLDASLSMNLSADGRPLFEQARQLAIERVQSCPPGDGFSVLVLKDSPTWVIGEASQDARKVIRELEAVRPSHGNAAVAPALGMVSSKLTEAAGRFPLQAVYFVSDLQAATWRNVGAASPKGDATKERAVYDEIQQRARTVFVDVGHDDLTENLAVTDLAFNVPFVTANAPAPMTVVVQNLGKKARTNVRLELLAGKAKETANDPALTPRVVDQRLLPEVKPGERLTVNFGEFKLPAAGTYVVQSRIDGGEPLDLDDARAVVITVKETIPVLLVNGKPAADRFERGTEYLRIALNPFRPGSEPRGAPLRPKVINAAQFLDITEAELAEYDCIFLADVGQIGPGDLRRLETHLRRGGGLVVSLGDKAADNLEAYNRLLHNNDQGLLPARLVKKVPAPPEHHFYFNAAEEEFLLPPLREFADELYRVSLRNVRFRQFVEAKVTEGKARTVLSFMPEVLDPEKAKVDTTLPVGAPALVEWNPPLPKGQQPAVLRNADGTRRALPPAQYRGKVALFTATLNMDWTNWPGSPSYGAMMQELTRLAISGRLKEQATNVGGLLEEFLPGGAETEATVHPPATMAGLKPGKVQTQLVEDVNVFRWADTDASGIYRAVLASTGQEVPFAVNVPGSTGEKGGSESDLTRLDARTLKELYPTWDFQLVRDARGAMLPDAPAVNPDDENGTTDAARVPVGPRLAHIALLLAFALILAEVVLAWRFGHYSTVDPAATPAATGLLSPALAAVGFGVVFVLGAWMLHKAHATGDFLDFLPDVYRRWAEAALGVPAPPPGESTNWQLETMGFLPGFGDERWAAGMLALLSVGLIFFTYWFEGPAVSRIYKGLLGCLRLFLVLTMLWVLLPQLQLAFPLRGWPDLVLLIDTSRSMGEPDNYQDAAVAGRAAKLGDVMRKTLQDVVPEKLKTLETQIAARTAAAEKDDGAKAEVEALQGRLQYWQKQQDLLASEKWRPTRLQLVQALLNQPDVDWLKTLLHDRQMKVHVYTLDANGRATKLTDDDGAAGEVVDRTDPRQLDRAAAALRRLDPDGRESRLGTAVRQVVDQYRGAALAGVIMFTDGVTTRDEPVAQAAEYAAQKGVPLFFVGVGDDHQIRDLKLHDLQVDDNPYVGDRILFECRLTGQGYKDLTVPVVLKVKEKDGKEKEVSREMVKVDPTGKSVKVRLRHQATEVGRKQYVIEVEPPKADPRVAQATPANLRLERTIEVVDNKLIRVLYVEGQPRYEFRYLKFLLEREDHDEKKKNRSIELKVVLLDADAEFAAQDKTALADFPATMEELLQYDVIVLGDCDPRHAKLGEQRLRNIASFVRGADEKGKKTGRPGGGLLLIAGGFHNPHSYKDTPLADVMPIEPLANKVPPEPANRAERMKPNLTPVGRLHPIFKFSQDEAENLSVWQRLAPIYFYATGYRIKPLAEVLAVHPSEKAAFPEPNQDPHHPLVVQQFVGSGRSMFFGFDETWRWRLREDEVEYNNFWVQTMRYLARGRSNRTELRLDRQTPYRLGDPIKVTVNFPDTMPGGVKPGEKDKTKVLVTVEYHPGDGKELQKEPEVQTLQLAKVEGSTGGTYEGVMSRTREGKYRFRLISPDVSKTQPDGEKPAADAVVELPPGELDRLRMNEQELRQAAEATQGRFYTLATAEQVLEDVPPGFRVALSAPTPPVRLWNQWWVFALVMSLLTTEWLLRKRKHLL